MMMYCGGDGGKGAAVCKDCCLARGGGIVEVLVSEGRAEGWEGGGEGCESCGEDIHGVGGEGNARMTAETKAGGEVCKEGEESCVE